MTIVPHIPTATYRLQFKRDFTFRDAERLVPYLQELGISHIYTSPYLKAREGSPHGYDITDYSALNPEIGDEDDLNALARTLADNGMGQVLDFVANHMGIGKADNPWWLDVLEWGQASPYADYFDIDWMSAKRELRGKVLLPFLGNHYGQVLESGELTLSFDGEQGSFGVRYHDHLFPICPAHYADILAPLTALEADERTVTARDIDAVSEAVERSRSLRLKARSARRSAGAREQGLKLKEDLAELAQASSVQTLIDFAVGRFVGVPGDTRSFIPLHRLLERQAYRLAYWRVAADEINYRRFFDINELAGIKMERLDLFEAAHALLWRWIGGNRVDGVRVDHIDGLFDPAQYCRRLVKRMTEIRSAAEGPGDTLGAQERANDTSPTAYLVVEKILARHESLRQDWPVAGTSGYEILNLINGLFVYQENEPILDRIYRQATGQGADFEEILYRSKKHVLEHLLSSELQVLANDLDRISETNWRTRDFTLAGLRATLAEVAACFPVYRTYVDESGASAEDRQNIDWAIALARRRSPDPESSIFDFVHSALTTDLVRGRSPGYNRRAVVRFAKKFQQFTGPVTAKALEDTSFYRFVRLLSLNEVGSDPRRFGVTVSAFHHLNRERARYWPHAMTATSTHDTKRGEDARARLNVLSERPQEWGRQVRLWTSLNRRAKTDRDGERQPIRNDEYFLYQTLLGSWPNDLLDMSALDEDLLDSFRERVETCMVKAVREAKTRSSWAYPNEEYEEAIKTFTKRILDPIRSAKFLSEIVPYARENAWFGMLNSLSQTLLKVTVPGVPDVYQGAELWDYSMVDPDNRRPVDFRRRRGLLTDLRSRFGGSGRESIEGWRELIREWPDGRIKLYVVHRLLDLRRERPDLFSEGDYLPLEVGGDRAHHVCAFARSREGVALVVVAPRFFTSLADVGVPPTGACWADTSIVAPAVTGRRVWTDVLTGTRHRPTGSQGNALALRRVLADLPVSALISE